MNRLGLLHPSTLTGRHMSDTRAIFDAFCRHNSASYGHIFTTNLPSTGALTGPWAVLLHTPMLGRAYLDLSLALEKLGPLSARSRSISALTIFAHERVPYGLYAERLLGLSEGLSEKDIEILFAGKLPYGFNDADRAIYFVSKELSHCAGPLSQQTWDWTLAILGKDMLVALIHYAAFLRYTATFMRGFGVQLPAEGDRVEVQRQRTPSQHFADWDSQVVGCPQYCILFLDFLKLILI
ncbi:hypothetical protein D0868_13631 [Hortaea werneckii]|uniref:Uncharacterized protein n=1 Tax=Hortaea werneckii TaxID=91943 RepID=A0A3M7B8N8_HORWE|nr:hypothetical protein D0868_13631 [Hortaea werneckii]RMY36119.1 hypothetical protein D0866_04154 [Hortaea werneckii]